MRFPRPVEHLWPSAEQQLLLEAALGSEDRAVTSYERWRRNVSLESDFNYASLRLLPLVYENLSRVGVRDALMGRLKGVYRRAWYETHRLFHVTRPAIAELTEREIPVLLLKGAPLVLSYYGNPALRPMADVDVAVPASRLEDALGALARHGWRPELQVDADEVRFRHAVRCFHEGGGEIDLHWRVMYQAREATLGDEFWSATEPCEFMGTPARQLDPTMLLLHVIVHGVSWNTETPVRWIPDALIVLRRRGMDVDWDRLVSFAQRCRITTRLELGLTYLRDLFNAPVPTGVLARLRGLDATLVERIENTVLLNDATRFARPIGNQWLWFVEYCRVADAHDPAAFVNGFSHYVRYRLGVDGRRDILPYIVRGLRRRLRRNDAETAHTNGNGT